MSERTPKQPLNDPEYTVPEYSVLLPSDEAKNSTAEGDTASSNVASGASPPLGLREHKRGGDTKRYPHPFSFPAQ